MGTQIRVPPFLLESYMPVQPLHAPISIVTPSAVKNPENQIQIGLMKASRELLSKKPLSPVNVLWFSAVRNYNVQVVFMLPITHFAHTDGVQHCSNENLHCGKEVFIISGEYKGWRGMLRRGGKDSCEVEVGAFKLAMVKANNVVVRGNVIDTLKQSTYIEDEFILKTPLLTNSSLLDGIDDQPTAGTSSNPWMVDNDDVALAETLASDLNFLLQLRVVESLKHYHAVFKILPGWQDSFLDHQVKTKVPSPFQSPSGQQVPPSCLAVFLTN
ncbi:hypothetical protein BU15DRAFT_63653 [Melanogaster broomeanus]|nr:hypothetical protein BU15DRAFT_63653 [Melanogaster broomeanus]